MKIPTKDSTNDDSSIIEILTKLLYEISEKEREEIHKEEILLGCILFRKYLEKEKIYKIFENKSDSFHKVIHFSGEDYETKEYFSSAFNYAIQVIILKYDENPNIFNIEIYSNLLGLNILSTKIKNKLSESIMGNYFNSTQNNSKNIEEIFIQKISYNQNDLGNWIVEGKFGFRKKLYFYSDIKLFPGSIYSFKYDVYKNIEQKSKFYKIIDRSVKMETEKFLQKVKNHDIYKYFFEEINSMWEDKSKPIFNNIFYSKENWKANKIYQIMKMKNIYSISEEENISEELRQSISGDGKINEVFIKLFPAWIKNYNSSLKIGSKEMRIFFPTSVSFILANYSLSKEKDDPKLSIQEKIFWSKILGEDDIFIKIFSKMKNNLIINISKKNIDIFNKIFQEKNIKKSNVLCQMYSFTEEEDGFIYNFGLKNRITEILEIISENKIKKSDEFWFKSFGVERCHNDEENNKKNEYFWSSNKINFLVDFAGVGKTTMVKKIIDKILQKNIDKIVLIAPTHKALSIYYDLQGKGIENITSQKWIKDCKERKKCICKYNAILIDEASMISSDEFLKIISHSCLEKNEFPPVLFIGDTNQLEPINKGEDFDFFESLVNYFKYIKDYKILHRIIPKKIKIEKLIMDNKVRYQENYMKDVIKKLYNSVEENKFKNPDPNLFEINYYSNEFDALQQVNNNINRHKKGEGIVVLSPSNHGLLGTRHLELSISKNIDDLSEGENVMCNDKSNSYCKNGVTYKILEKHKIDNIANNWKFILSPLNTKEIIEVETNNDENTIHSLHVLSIHKSQGSTFEKVIIVIPQNYTMDFKMFYTAITRASKSVVIISHISFKIPEWEYKEDKNISKLISGHLVLQ